MENGEVIKIRKLGQAAAVKFYCPNDFLGFEHFEQFSFFSFRASEEVKKVIAEWSTLQSEIKKFYDEMESLKRQVMDARESVGFVRSPLKDKMINEKIFKSRPTSTR